MYSLEEVEKALEKDKLSDALYKLHRYSKNNGLDDLAQWCYWELHGYPSNWGTQDESEKEKITAYRSVGAQWKDVYGRTAMIDNRLGFLNKVPVPLGITEFEGAIESGCSYIVPRALEMINEFATYPIQSAWIVPNELKGLFNRIRFEARSRFHEAQPRIPRSLNKMGPGLPGIPHVEAAKPLFNKMIYLVGIIAALLIGGGIYAIVKDSLSETKINMLGLSVSTGHVGVAFVSLGAILIVLVFRYIISHIYKLSALPEVKRKKNK